MPELQSKTKWHVLLRLMVYIQHVLLSLSSKTMLCFFDRNHLALAALQI